MNGKPGDDPLKDSAEALRQRPLRRRDAQRAHAIERGWEVDT